MKSAMFRQGGWWTKQEEAMAQALIYKASHTRPLGKCLRCWPYMFYSRKCIMVAYILFSVMAVVGLAMLIVFGICVVQPYLKSLEFQPTQCRSVKSWYVKHEDGSMKTKSCSCGKHCYARWPCLHVTIQYAPLADGEIYEATLADSQYELSSGHGCSYEPTCQRTGANRYAVEGYKKKYGKASSFPCYYNPADKSMVFRKRRLSDIAMLHILLWPSVFTLFVIGMLVVIILTCGCKFIWKQKPPTAISDYGSNGDGHYYHHHNKGFIGRCSMCSRNEEININGIGGGEAGNVLIQKANEQGAEDSTINDSKSERPIPIADI